MRKAKPLRKKKPHYYPTYEWRGDRDRSLFEMREALDEAGEKWSDLSRLTNVSQSTFGNWFGRKGKPGTTRQPKMATVRAFM